MPNRCNTFANIPAIATGIFTQSCDLFSSAFGIRRRRRNAANRGRALYLEALEIRQLYSGSPPTVSIVSLGVSENGALTFSPASFQDHYTDPDNDPLDSIEFVSLPAHGALTLTVNGVDTAVDAFQVIPVDQISNLKYSPNLGFVGIDSFGWNASDGTQFANAAASILLGVEAPTALTFSKDVFEFGTLNFTADDFNSHYSGGSPIQSIKIMSLPSNGTLNLTVNSVTNPIAVNQVINVGDLGGISYTPNPGYVGPDSFGWSASDGFSLGDAVASVSITVSPPIAGDIAKILTANTVLNFTGSDFASAFSTGTTLIDVIVLTLPAHGTLVLNQNSVDTAVTPNEIIPLDKIVGLKYTPDTNYTGADSFTWEGIDVNATSSGGHVNITINPPTTVIGFTESLFSSRPFPFKQSDFANHTGSNPIVSITIATLPGRGTLMLANGTSIAPVTVHQVITVDNFTNLS